MRKDWASLHNFSHNLKNLNSIMCSLLDRTSLEPNCAAFHRIHNRLLHFFGHFIYWILYPKWVKFHLCLQVVIAFTAQIFMKLTIAQWHYAYIFCTEFHLNPSRPTECARGNTFIPLVWTSLSWFSQNPHLPEVFCKERLYQIS